MPTHVSRNTFNGDTATSFSHSLDAGSAADRVLVVAIRHGQATDNITHTASYAGQAMTQVDGYVSATVVNPTRRRLSVWKLLDPASGANNLTGTFSATVAQYSIGAIVTSGAGDIDATSLATLESQASGTAMDIDITPDAGDSLLYVLVMAASGTADPFSPISGTTEIEDAAVDGTSTNHSFASGHSTVTTAGVAQNLGFTAGTANEWGAVALEVTDASVEPTVVELEARTVEVVVG